MAPTTYTAPVNTLLSLPLSIAGGRFPVRSVTVDLVGDNAPASYFLVADARGEHVYMVGPLARPGRFQLTASATDERGCEGTLGAYVVVTVTP